MIKNKPIIRNMTFEDLKKVVKWAESEGWNPGLHDAECFFGTDNKGFYTGELNGEIISAISVVKYEQNFAFLGFYIVKPEYRQRGYGFDLWNTIVKKHSDYNIGLDGVVNQQENYRKSGFKLAHNNIRFKGFKVRDFDSTSTVDLKNIPFNKLVQYDQKHFPTRREVFLRHWISQKKVKAFGIIEKEKIKGYGVIRKCFSGYKIGPLFAEDPMIAEKLFAALVNTLDFGEEFYLDIPEINHNAMELVMKHQMVAVFETARMYTKEIPDISPQNTYGITTFELG